jgi:hypothetical protein
MTRIPENPPVTFTGPLVRCGPHGELAAPDGADIHVPQCPREARPSLGHHSFGALSPPAWPRAHTPAAAPRRDPPGLRLVVSTPDGDPPIRSAAHVHVFPGR